MDAKRVTWTAVALGMAAAAGIMGCRKEPGVSKGDVSGSPKAVSAGNKEANNAKMWVPPFAGMAVNASGIPWAIGRIYSPFDFGSGSVSSSGGADLYLAKLDPATCRATETFIFGGSGGKDQVASGVAVAAKGNVGIIGYFTGEIEFTPRRPGGVGATGRPRSEGIELLKGGSQTAFYGVFDGDSKGGAVTPIKAHKVDLGSGALLSVSSNPGQNFFAICGKTDNAVTKWEDSGDNGGVITGSKSVAGGGMDILVAKIDAASGAVVWGRQFGGAGDQVCESVTVDNNGDVIIAGGYSGALAFDRVSLPKVADLSSALLYVAKLNGTTGAAIAARAWGHTGRSNAYGLVTDSDGNIVLGGALGADIDFGSGISITNFGWTDAFVVKLTSALVPVWAKSFGDADFDQVVKAVGVSSKGDVFIGGTFQGSLGILGLTSAGKTAPDAFTAEFAAGDGATISAEAWGDGEGAQAVSTVTVARAVTGSLKNSKFIGGTFSSTIKFGATTLNSGSPKTLASYVARLVP